MWLQSCDQSFLAILLKDAFDRCFLQLQVTPEPARTHAACVSLSLFTMSISNGIETPTSSPKRKKPRIPFSGHPDVHAQPVGFRQKRPAAPQAPRPSVMGLIWRCTPDCQHWKTRKCQKTDKWLICNVHPAVIIVGNRAPERPSAGLKPSRRSKTWPSARNRPPRGPVEPFMPRLP